MPKTWTVPFPLLGVGLGSAFRACSNPVKVTRIACFFVGMEVAAASFEGGEALVGEVGYLASHLQVRIRNIIYTQAQ